MRSYYIMLALMRGDLAETERRVIQSMALQRRGLTAHEDQLSIIIFTLRREQGRLARIPAGIVVVSASATGLGHPWLPGLALLYVEIGQLDDARLEFERLAADDFAAVARDGRWYFCMAYLSEVVRRARRCGAGVHPVPDVAALRWPQPGPGRRPRLLRIG